MPNETNVFQIKVRRTHDLEDITDSELYEKQVKWYLSIGFDVIDVEWLEAQP